MSYDSFTLPTSVKRNPDLSSLSSVGFKSTFLLSGTSSTPSSLSTLDVCSGSDQSPANASKSVSLSNAVANNDKAVSIRGSQRSGTLDCNKTLHSTSKDSAIDDTVNEDVNNNEDTALEIRNVNHYNQGLRSDIVLNDADHNESDVEATALPSSATNQTVTTRRTQSHTNEKNKPTTASSPALPSPHLSDAVLLQLEDEKKLLHMLNYPPPSLFPNFKGTLWSTVLHIDWSKMQCIISSMDNKEINKKRGILFIYNFLDQATDKDVKTGLYHTLAKHLVICPLCLDDATRALNDCLITCGIDSTSNIGQHWKKFHPNEPNPTSSEKGSGGASIISRQSSIRFKTTTTKAVSASMAQSLVRNAIYKCINDLGFPTNTSEKEPFRDLLQTVLTMQLLSKNAILLLVPKQ